MVLGVESRRVSELVSYDSEHFPCSACRIVRNDWSDMRSEKKRREEEKDENASEVPTLRSPAEGKFDMLTRSDIYVYICVSSKVNVARAARVLGASVLQCSMTGLGGPRERFVC